LTLQIPSLYVLTIFSFFTPPSSFLFQVKVIQKSTRSLNTLCAEGKVRGDMNVVLRVSRLKKGIESFINESYLLLSDLAPELSMEFGELKHKDLQGNALATSQMFPHAEEEEEVVEEEEEMEEEEEYGDEDMIEDDEI
jgi:fanconi anemia group D2 protein